MSRTFKNNQDYDKKQLNKKVKRPLKVSHQFVKDLDIDLQTVNLPARLLRRLV